MNKKISIDCERMQYPNTGLYSYCFFLTQALIETLNKEERLFVYGQANNKKLFGDKANYIQQSPFHKIIFPSISDIDIWHSTYQNTEYFPFNRNVKKVLTIHDLNFLHEQTKSSSKKSNYLRKLTEKVKKSDHVVFISHFVKEDFSKHIDLKAIPHSIIYNGIGLEKIERVMDPINAPSGEFIFALGLITPKKNFHVLPSILVNNQYKLIIAGDVQNKEYKDKIIEEAIKFGVVDRIQFAGAISENDKQWFYQHCTAFVFPSIAEGFGLPAIEAMSFGKPVFLSNHTSLPEIGGNKAFYFNEFDPSSMQAIFTKGLAQFNESNMTDKIIEHSSQFNWTKAAEQYLAVYRSLY